MLYKNTWKYFSNKDIEQLKFHDAFCTCYRIPVSVRYSNAENAITDATIVEYVHRFVYELTGMHLQCIAKTVVKDDSNRWFNVADVAVIVHDYNTAIVLINKLQQLDDIEVLNTGAGKLLLTGDVKLQMSYAELLSMLETVQEDAVNGDGCWCGRISLKAYVDEEIHHGDVSVRK